MSMDEHGGTRSVPARALDETAIKGIIENAVQHLATKDDMDKLISTLEQKLEAVIDEKIELAMKPFEDRIASLENKLSVYEAHMEKLEMEVEKAEQYSRRSCLRIYGIPVPNNANKNESSNDCVEKVMDLCKKMEVNIPDSEIDRAHRIGSKKRVEGVDQQAVIVKFKSWKSRCAFYRGRKKLDENSLVRIRMDLTVQRLKLLSLAIELSKKNSHVDFAFADVNCRLALKMTSGQFRFFNTEEELLDLL